MLSKDAFDEKHLTSYLQWRWRNFGYFPRRTGKHQSPKSGRSTPICAVSETRQTATLNMWWSSLHLLQVCLDHVANQSPCLPQSLKVPGVVRQITSPSHPASPLPFQPPSPSRLPSTTQFQPASVNPGRTLSSAELESMRSMTSSRRAPVATSSKRRRISANLHKTDGGSGGGSQGDGAV